VHEVSYGMADFALECSVRGEALKLRRIEDATAP
jgi:hypothetical protein